MIVVWGYIVLGKAYSEAGEMQLALESIRPGFAILDRSLGPDNPSFLYAEIAYSQVLEKAGTRNPAILLRARAEHTLADVRGRRCNRISVATLTASLAEK
jgi:hypothetical protein